MQDYETEILKIEKMASGNLCLNITEKINWEEFPKFAKSFIRLLNGNILSKFDGPDIRLWEVKINQRNYNLTFDDYPLKVSLESQDLDASKELNNILKLLVSLK